MKKIILFILVILTFISCDQREKQYLTDKSLIILEETLSNKKDYRIIQYNFDLGAIGDSRIFWAIIPTKFDDKEPINDFILPDGYKAIGWTNKDEIILEKWEPHYYKNEEIEYKNGDKFDNLFVVIKTKTEKQKEESSTKNISSKAESDTITIESKSAIIYDATDKSIEKQKIKGGEEDFYVGADDYLFYLNNAEKFLKTQNIKIVVTKNNKVLRFIMNDKSKYFVKLDTVKEIWGIYLFEPKQKPKRIDMTATEEEYKEYYK